LVSRLLNIIDRQFKTPLARVAGWTIIMAAAATVAGFAFPEAQWQQRLAGALIPAGITCLLVTGLVIIGSYRRRFTKPDSGMHWHAAPALFAMYTGLMFSVVALVVVSVRWAVLGRVW
jgi:hypothetical protein